MKKIVFIMICILLLAGCFRRNQETITTGSSKDYITYQSLTLEQVQDDFRQFRSLIDIQHPQLFADRQAVQDVLDQQEALLRDGMDIYEFYRVLLPVLGVLSDGHTAVYLPEEASDYAAEQPCYLPFLVAIHGDSIKVAVSIFEEQIPAGSEILSINGDQADEILAVFRALIPSDGHRPEAQDYLMNQNFNEFYSRQIGAPKEFKIEFYSPDGTSLLKKKVPGVVLADINHQREMAVTTYDLLDPTPFISEINNDYAYLRIKGTFSNNGNFFDEEFHEYTKKLDEFFITLRSQNIENLILDLRTGYGSNPLMASYLFSCLIDSPEPYFIEGNSRFFRQLELPQEVHDYHYDNRIFVLTDGSTISLWGQLAALLKYHERAVFIGEETGSGATTGLNVRFFPLPKTGLVFQYPAEMWTVAVKNMSLEEGIKPDYPAVQTMNDFLNNVDTVKEVAIKVIHGEM